MIKGGSSLNHKICIFSKLVLSVIKISAENSWASIKLAERSRQKSHDSSRCSESASYLRIPRVRVSAVLPRRWKRDPASGDARVDLIGSWGRGRINKIYLTWNTGILYRVDKSLGHPVDKKPPFIAPPCRPDKLSPRLTFFKSHRASTSYRRSPRRFSPRLLPADLISILCSEWRAWYWILMRATLCWNAAGVRLTLWTHGFTEGGMPWKLYYWSDSPLIFRFTRIFNMCGICPAAFLTSFNNW